MSKPRVLILGGNGFLGSNLVHYLSSRYTLKVFDQSLPSATHAPALEGVEYLQGDFKNELLHEALLDQVDMVVHFIWETLPATSNLDCAGDLRSNILPFLSLLEALKKKQNTRLIFISSGGTVYGDGQDGMWDEQMKESPLCSYGITKLMAEKYLQLYKNLYQIKGCVLRLANPYGPGQYGQKKQGFIGTALYHALTEKPLSIWGDGQVERDYIFVQDVMQAIESAMLYQGDELVFNIGSGQGTSLLEMIQLVETICEKPLKVQFEPKRNCDVRRNVLNWQKAKNHLKWEPKVSLREGVQKTLLWMKEEKITPLEELISQK